MTRMFFNAAVTRGVMTRFLATTAIAGVALVGGGCTTSTTEAPADTMDLTNVPPPEPVAAPEPIAAPTPTPPAADVPAAPAERTHTIAKGDTIYSLAVKYYGRGNKANMDKILAGNPGLVAERMSIGKTITIPN